MENGVLEVLSNLTQELDSAEIERITELIDKENQAQAEKKKPSGSKE
jgi:hypothetical protein